MSDSKLPDTTQLGNILGATALAFLVDRVALDGAVAKALPVEAVAVLAFVIFAGVFVYGYKQLKKLN
jgi:hypothetical protein